MLRYYVLSKRNDEDFVESIRTSKKAADQDVLLLKDICGRHAWVTERE